MIAIVSTCMYKLSEEEFLRPIVEIVRAFGNYKIVRYNEQLNFEVFSKVIICGTALRDIDYLKYIKNFECILNLNCDVLGICAGYHILAKLFNNKLEFIKKIGVYDVRVVKDNPLISKGTLKCYFLHTYALKRINERLKCLALQNDEICIFKVRNRRFYGVSFHPEVLNSEMITNFLLM